MLGRPANFNTTYSRSKCIYTVYIIITLPFS